MIYYHYAELVHRQAEKYGSRTALKYRDNATGKWLKISWKEFSEKVMLTAKAMAEFGIEVQDNIGVYSQNMPQCFYTDFGAYANRVVSIPMYATNSPGQIEYIINDAHIHTLFVGEQLQYNNAFKVQKESQYLKRLVVFDPAVKLNPEDKTSIYFDDFLRLGDNAHAETTVKIRTNEAVPEDLATIIYTSGTTGESKGVMLHHSNYLEAMRIHDIRLPMVTDKDLSMCFLPLTHIFEKAWSYYCLHKGVTIAINQDPKMIQKTLPEVHPTLMCNVPRFWEKVYAGVHEKINSSSSTMKKIFLDAIETGRKYNLEYKNKSIPAPFGLKLKFEMYNKTGYYNKPAENEKAFTEDGYFRTGDAGRMEGNTLFFTERIKDLYKTSNGKYIAPQAIEMVMSGDQYIEQIAVIGDQRKFVSALIVPAYPLLEKYAEEKGLAVGSRKELVRNKEILRLIETHIEENQKNLASYEKIKRFTLLSEPFTMGAELTDTLKLRRSVILKKYADPIEKMYEEASNMWGSNPV